MPGVRKKGVPLANFLAPLRGAVAGFSHGFSPRSKNVKTFMLECRSLNLVEESRWVFINQSVRVADNGDRETPARRANTRRSYAGAGWPSRHRHCFSDAVALHLRWRHGTALGDRVLVLQARDVRLDRRGPVLRAIWVPHHRHLVRLQGRGTILPHVLHAALLAYFSALLRLFGDLVLFDPAAL